MPRRTAVTDQHALILAADAVSNGVSRSTLRTSTAAGRLERPHRGVYRVPGAEVSHAAVRAALAHLGPEAVVVLGSAASVHGLAGMPRTWLPQIALPPGLERRQRDGVEIHFWDLPANHVEIVDGMAVTTAIRTVADTCRLLPRERAVCITDSALDHGALRPSDLAAVLALMARRRNCVAGRRHLGQARVGAQSPGETRLRLILDDAGLPPDALQIELRDDAGRLIGYADLGYALGDGTAVLVEFDGRSVHELPAALLHDRRRQNAAVASRRATMLRFAWDDLRFPERVVAQIRPMLSAAGWRPGRRHPLISRS